MAFCSKCGAQLEEKAAFCPQCGQAVAQPQQAAQPQAEPAAQQAPAQGSSGLNDFVQNLNQVEDTTAQFDPADIARSKAMAIIGYIGILFLIPLFAVKDSPFAQFHAKQSATLCIIGLGADIVLWILTAVTRFLLPLYAVMSILAALVTLAYIGLMIIGIINAADGKAKELPVIGSIHIIP